MSLTVTVQKGHDFSSGNITRAALNAGAVPTVAVTGAVGTTELIDQAVTDAKVSISAGVQLSKLAGQTANNVLVVSDDNATSSGKEIKALPGYLSGAIKVVSDEVEITPSDGTITADKLIANTDDSNIIFGLSDTLTDVQVDDYVVVHDSSVTGTANRLKKAKISSIQKVGSTEYDMSAISASGGPTNFEVEVDFDGPPFQTVSLTQKDKFYDFVIKANTQSSSTVKTVTIKILCASSIGSNNSDVCKFGVENEASGSRWDSGWTWLERTSNAGPDDIKRGMTALLSLTSFGASNADILAAYAVQGAS